MLVLRRKVNQALAIGSEVKIVVLSVDGESVRLGIDAPPNISIERVEGAERDELRRGPA